MIKTSLDWSNHRSNLLRKTHGLSNGREVRRMIKNIDPEITALSKAEVEQRRGRKYAADEILNIVNQDIEMVEEYLLVAALIG